MGFCVGFCGILKDFYVTFMGFRDDVMVTEKRLVGEESAGSCG